MKCLAIYGPTNFKRTFPEGSKNYFIKSRLHNGAPCSFMAKLPEEEALLKCDACSRFMNDIKPDFVLDYINTKKLIG